MKYYIEKVVELSFGDALARVADGLKAEGFGVLTEIDMSETMKKKLSVDLPGYRILGACNPSLAHQALQVDERIGLLLPCNVIVRETPEGKVEVAAIDPAASMQTVGNPRLIQIAQQVQAKLKRVITAL